MFAHFEALHGARQPLPRDGRRAAVLRHLKTAAFGTRVPGLRRRQRMELHDSLEKNKNVNMEGKKQKQATTKNSSTYVRRQKGRMVAGFVVAKSERK